MPTSDAIAERIAAALPKLHMWEGRAGDAELAGLPNCPAVLLFVDAAGTPIQLLTTQQLRRFVTARLKAPAEARRGRADLMQIARGVRWRPVHCPFEARWWYYRLARVLHPHEYRRLVSFGPAWFLRVDWSQEVPEIRVSDQAWGRGGECVGPWSTQRASQAALQGLWDLFDLCRYPEQVRKAPNGTRCAYADMGRCDAPCDGSVPLDAYRQRCRAAWQFATGGVSDWSDAAQDRMKHAAAGRQYERAAQIKQQIAFARRWQTEWQPHVRPLEQLSCFLALPATRRRAWKLFLFRHGHLSEGPVLSDRRFAVQAPAWLSAELSRAPEEADDVLRTEQTWLVCHLLLGRERAAAMVAPLPNLAAPPDLERYVELERARLGVRCWRAESKEDACRPDAQ